MIFEAKVRDLASDGRGVVATEDGRTCFVSGVWRGEIGKFRLLAKKGKIYEAELIELLEASSTRRAPPCQFHGFSESHCGGCAWQFVEYQEQLKAKYERVKVSLSRLQSDLVINPIHGSPEELSYRNRAQFKTDGELIGFSAGKSNSLVAISDCPVLTDINRQTLKGLIRKLPNNAWRPTRKSRGKPFWTTLDINESSSVDNVQVNQRLEFQQGNSSQNSFMQAWLKEKLRAIEEAKNVLELFCGSGNFTDGIAQMGFAQIVAVEVDERSVSTLKAKKLANVEAVCANLFESGKLESLIRKTKNTEILILDPPRDGFKLIGECCKGFDKLKNVLYVSCDLATFTRDARELIKNGFTIKELQAIDLFPQTPHVELLAHFSKT